MNLPFHSDRESIRQKHAETARKLNRAFRDFCDATKRDMHVCADAGAACGYTEWLYETGKARFGVDNTLTHHAVIGAARRLQEGNIGTFFQFLHAKEADVMEALGVPADDPYRQKLSAALSEAVALPSKPHPRSRS